MRQRYILQYPNNGGASCPELLKEVQQCQDLPFCRGFQWDTTEWSHCILPPDVKKCGLGLKARGRMKNIKN
ncbi:hypothetical protein KUTeg_015118 [Tegillarca granosa]|uniref:Uncharacterized protein n=1 Tax=Tegillarca granosa TaxID=220873 RepID=A0ABQ9EPW1_TEGGR|nr:hypothetical protein KUTeg_015118 [Tegillarca granosa]